MVLAGYPLKRRTEDISKSMGEDNNFTSSLESFAAKLAQQLLTEHAWAWSV